MVFGFWFLISVLKIFYPESLQPLLASVLPDNTSKNRNLWLDTLDDDSLSSDEDQNDLEIVSHGNW